MESAEKNIFLEKNQYFFTLLMGAVAKYLIPQRLRQLLSVLNLTVPFSSCFLLV